MNNYRLLDVLTFSAAILVESGSEISRVSKTIYLIAHTYGIKDTGVFITPTGLQISFDHEGKTFSRIKRVQVLGFDVEKLNRVNQLARTCGTFDLDHFYHALEAINGAKGYSVGLKSLAGGGMAFFFTIFFQGTLGEGLFAFFIGSSMQFFKLKMEGIKFNPMISIILLSAYFTILPILLLHFGFIENQNAIITGCLMLVVPGLAFISAIRDSLAGDTLSGLVRGFEAILSAIGIVIGTVAILALWAELNRRGWIL